jgi:ABC-type oligopeptide transport system substrate-binding subunit
LKGSIVKSKRENDESAALDLFRKGELDLALYPRASERTIRENYHYLIGTPHR